MPAVDDTLWVLREAAKPSGFSPNAEGVRGFVIGLEMEGLVRQSNNYPCWYITERGRTVLAESEE